MSVPLIPVLSLVDDISLLLLVVPEAGVFNNDCGGVVVLAERLLSCCCSWCLAIVADMLERAAVLRCELIEAKSLKGVAADCAYFDEDWAPLVTGKMGDALSVKRLVGLGSRNDERRAAGVDVDVGLS